MPWKRGVYTAEPTHHPHIMSTPPGRAAHLWRPPVLTWKQKRPWVNSLVCDRAAAFCAAGPPEVLSRLVTQAAERERELARARSQRLKQAARSLPSESVSRGFAGRGALEGYPSHYTSLVRFNSVAWSVKVTRRKEGQIWIGQGYACVWKYFAHWFIRCRILTKRVSFAWVRR